ncbi:Plastocyanin-like protein [Corchorus olitorius]|uniref:Plastocyanin-like protein n=1 Tax=Corchorus olitorius TaxID=93759 RepID=A0A1R3GI66_9ROSI|nr:Plastocyanin-like protein [Corchorus olitorius]
MASRLGMGFFFIASLIAAMGLFQTAVADTYTVGDDLGWTIPPGGSIAYSTWARTKNFEINDTIVFSWTNTHDVAEVSEADYENCTKTNPIGSVQQTSPANFTLDSNRSRYFICTINNHCELGQKVTINIGEWNSASSLTVGATLSLLLSTIVISLLSHQI